MELSPRKRVRYYHDHSQNEDVEKIIAHCLQEFGSKSHKIIFAKHREFTIRHNGHLSFMDRYAEAEILVKPKVIYGNPYARRTFEIPHADAPLGVLRFEVELIGKNEYLQTLVRKP